MLLVFVLVLLVRCDLLCSSHMQHHLGKAHLALHQRQSARILQILAHVWSQMYLQFWQMPLLRLVLGTNLVVARFYLLFYTCPYYSSLGIIGQVLLKYYTNPKLYFRKST